MTDDYKDAKAKMKAGASLTRETGDREVVVVLVRGHAIVGCEGLASREIGARMSPFDGAPWSMYVPPHTRYTIAATDDVELGRGAIPPGQDTEPAPTRSFSGDARSADASARRRRCAEEKPDRRAMCSTVADAQAGSPSSRRAASMRVRRICSLIPPGNAVSRP